VARSADIFRELRPTLALAFPIVVGQVGQMLMGITDTVMIGRVGAVPLAASAFANGVCNLVFIVGVGLLLPVAVLTARAHGAKEPRECAEYLRHGIALGWWIGVVALVGLGALATQLHRFGQPAEVVAEVNPYYLLLSASLLPSFLFQVLKQYAEALGHPWAPMRILIACVGVNVVLNWILIYGNLGAPALGLEGAGWATLIARTLAVLILAWWLTHRAAVRAEWPERWRGALSGRRLREMMHIGVPAAGQWLFEAGAFSAAAFMMGWLGTVPLAAHQVALSCAAFTFMFPLGMSSAVSVRLSKMLGEERHAALRPIGFGALGAGFAIMSVFGLIFAFGGALLARGFTPEREVVELAAQLLIVAGIF
jgi:multidrug resistance protein, MATE family